MFQDSSSGFNLRRSNPKMVVSAQHLNSWIPYLNIALIFCVICVYGLGPCESNSAFLSQRSNSFIFLYSNFWFLFYFIVQVVCLWLLLLTSSYKPGVLPLMWSAEPSTGWACSWWGCCSVTLWWETRSYLSFKVGHAHRGVADFIILTQELTTSAISLMGSDPAFPSRITLARSASWFSWLTPSPAVHFCYGLFQRPKEGQWWR